MNVFIRAMVRIFSCSERWNVQSTRRSRVDWNTPSFTEMDVISFICSYMAPPFCSVFHNGFSKKKSLLKTGNQLFNCCSKKSRHNRMGDPSIVL